MGIAQDTVDGAGPPDGPDGEEAGHEEDANLLSATLRSTRCPHLTSQARARAILGLAQRELAHQTRACELLLATSALPQRICDLAP